MDIRDVKTEHIMVSMSCVFRDSFLFSDTLYNNIAIGKPGATKGEVYTAAKGTLRVPDTFNFFSAWISYLMLGIAPYACILVAVGNGLLYVMTIWTLISHIPVIWLQYILKVIALIFVAMLELGLVIKVMGRLEE